MTVLRLISVIALLASVGFAEDCRTWSLQNYERQRSYQLIANNDPHFGEVERYAFWSDRYPEVTNGGVDLPQVALGAGDASFDSTVWFSYASVNSSKPYLHLVTSRLPQKSLSKYAMLKHKIRGGSEFIQLDVSLLAPVVAARTSDVELCVFDLRE